MSIWSCSAAALPDPDRSRPPVALEVVENHLGDLGAAVDSVEHLQPPLGWHVPAPVFEPAHEGRRFVDEAQAHQAVEGEGGVADPRVAVVPIAPATEESGSDVVGAATKAPVG